MFSPIKLLRSQKMAHEERGMVRKQEFFAAVKSNSITGSDMLYTI